MAKERVSLTVERELIEWIDNKIKEKIFANRSHAFEYAIKQLMNKEQELKGKRT